jgi:hypothetical protein
MSRLATQAGLSALVPLAALGSALLLLAATRSGPGVTPDGVVYLEAGRRLAAGEGFGEAARAGGLAPPGHFPPLYPALLAALARAGLAPQDAARALAAGLLASNVWLMGIGAGRACPGLRAAAPLAAWLAAASAHLLGIHAFVLSEPLFLALALGALLSLARHLEGGGRRAFAAAAALAALALLDRYAGAALALAGALALALCARPRRLAGAVLFAALAALPLCVFLAWLAEAPPRELALHPISWGRMRLAVATLAGWLLLGRLPFAAQAAALAALGLAMAALARRAPREPASEVARVFACFGAVYALFLPLSVSLADAHTPLNARLLAPLYPVALVLALRAAQHALRFSRGRAPRAIALAGALLFTLASGRAALAFALSARADGVAPGYATRAWAESPLVARLRQLDAGTPVYSNAPDAVVFLTGREARWLPRRREPVSRQPRGDLAAQLAALRRDVEERGAVVAWFDELAWRSYLLTRPELERLPLRSLGRFSDGALYAGR